MSARSSGFGRFLSLVASVLAATLPSPLLPATVGVGTRPCIDIRDVTVTPESPRAGTLFELRFPSIRDVASVEIAGVRLAVLSTVPGGGDTIARVLAAVPLDSTAGITVGFSCAGNPSVVPLRLAVDSGRYRNERLRVAPRFSVLDAETERRIEREAARAAEVARASLSTPVLWRDAFVAPRGSRITSVFGSRRTFNGETVSRHTGTDYAGATGSPVRASNRGVVRLIGAFYLGGNVVYLDHGGGLTTAYLHLSRVLVAEGDTVERAGTIGRVGATGRVTGPHLHFIARLGGITVDPVTLVGRR